MEEKQHKPTDEVEVEIEDSPEETQDPDEQIADVDEQPEEADREKESAKPEKKTEPDWEDRYLRLAAEFDNYKKRTAREYATIIKNAEERLILEITDVLDNFERSLDPEHRSGKLDEFVKGIELIYSQFKSILEKHGLSRMQVIGEPFDPEKHEAMMQSPSVDIPEGHVTGEIAVGYMLGDKVLRHAKVMVSGGPPEEKEE